MNKESLILIGGGGHAHVVADAARLSNWDVIGYVAPTQSADAPGPYLGIDTELPTLARNTTASFVVAIGSISPGSSRAEIFDWLKSLSVPIASIIHPSAIVASSAKIANGCQIMAGAVVQPAVTLFENVIINTNASVDHHSIVGAHTHIAPGAIICGNVTIGPSCHIGPGAVIIQNAQIPEKTFAKANSCST